MKALVLYKSKTGFTKKYAEWIAEELSADLFEAGKITPDQFAEYETVIYGGGLYAVGINGVKLITDNFEQLKGKKVVLFATGASPSREEVVSEVRNQNLTFEQQQFIRFFYLRGGFDFKKLQFTDKILMILLKWRLKKKSKDSLTSDERGMLSAYNNPVDFTRRQNIEQIIAFINE